jgi:hypothetical protein
MEKQDNPKDLFHQFIMKKRKELKEEIEKMKNMKVTNPQEDILSPWVKHDGKGCPVKSGLPILHLLCQNNCYAGLPYIISISDEDDEVDWNYTEFYMILPKIPKECTNRVLVDVKGI